MPFEERYTPVPGVGPSPEMTQTGSGMGRPSVQAENYFYDEGSVPAAHRFSYTDSPSRPSSQIYSDPNMPGPSRGESFGSSIKDPMTAGGGTAGPQMSQRGMAYQNIPSEQYWGDNAATSDDDSSNKGAKSTRNRWLKIGGIVFAIIAIIAIVVGVVVSQVTKKGSHGNSNASASDSGGSGSGGNGSNNGGSGTSGGTGKNGNSASDFEKDPRLHQSFWALAYTPQGVILPNCAVSQANVTRDIQLLSQLTTRLRLYGANCNATAVVLQAIQDTKVDMTIWPAIYIDSNTQAYKDQVTAVTSALKTYGTSHVEGIVVGNEYILNTAGTDSTTSATYLSAVQDILTHVTEVNTTIKGMNLDKHLPIGTSDAGSVLSTTLASGIDFFMANVHPWFGSVNINDAAAWTSSFFQEFDVNVANTAPNKPNCYIAETGWPTASDSRAAASNGAGSPGGDASLANLQTFMDTWVCSANKNGTEYFFFEAFDEPWKRIYGGVEPHWGIFDENRNLKNITIPTCS